MIVRCFDCPMTIITDGQDSQARSWICSECAHGRGLTPILAERIAIEDAKWNNPASIWEATPKEFMKTLVSAITDCLEQDADNLDIAEANRDSWVSYKIAHRVVTVMNHIWFGPEVLLK